MLNLALTSFKYFWLRQTTCIKRNDDVDRNDFELKKWGKNFALGKSVVAACRHRVAQVAWRAGHCRRTRTFRTVFFTRRRTTPPNVRPSVSTTPGVLEWISCRQIQWVATAGSAVLGPARQTWVEREALITTASPGSAPVSALTRKCRKQLFSIRCSRFAISESVNSQSRPDSQIVHVLHRWLAALLSG